MAKNNKSIAGSSSNTINNKSKSSAFGFILTFHLIAAAQFAYSVYYDHTYVRFSISDSWGGKLKFLTFIDAILQTVYYIIAVANDFVGTNEAVPKRMPLVRKLKDFLMATLAFPIALTVGISFWSIYAIDRELIFPKALDAIFPGWLNHVMHTNIVVFIILEMFTSVRVYPSRKQGITALLTFLISYLIWIHIIKYNSGIWVYPILDVLGLPQRIIFFIIVLLFTLGLYLLGEFINNTVWSKEIKSVQKKVK